MTRYIDAEILTKAIENRLNEEDEKFAFGHDACEILSMIYAMEDADVAPVVHGEWIHKRFSSSTDKIHCSVCGRAETIWIYADASEVFPCCHCGAKMDLNCNGSQ